MRLYKFLNEAEIDYEKVLVECAPFLKEVKAGPDRRLKHGTKTFPGKYKTDKNREPRDTNWEAHSFMNAVYKKYLGKRLRSETVFATFNNATAAQYGDPKVILPIGKYTLYQNKIFEDATLDVFNEQHGTEYMWKRGAEVDFWNVVEKHGIEPRNILDRNKFAKILHPRIVVMSPTKLEKFIKTNLSDKEIKHSGVKASTAKDLVKQLDPIISELYNELVSIFRETRAYSLHQLGNRSEVMIYCDEYYLLDNDEYWQNIGRNL